MEFRDKDTITRYFCTDGSCSGNPGVGSYAVIEVDSLNPKYVYYSYFSPATDNTTNNREELKAIIHVLKYFTNYDTILVIYTDSAYCQQMLTDWIWNWAQNDWRTITNKPIENLDLVQEAFKYIKKYNSLIEIHKVRGHSGTIGNELADALATKNLTKYKTILKRRSIEEELWC